MFFYFSSGLSREYQSSCQSKGKHFSGIFFFKSLNQACFSTSYLYPSRFVFGGSEKASDVIFVRSGMFLM